MFRRIIKKDIFIVLLFISVSLTVRVVFLVFIRGYDFFTDYLTGDQFIYLNNARELINGNLDGISIIHPPLYSILLSIIFSIFGRKIVAILLLQYIIDGLSAFFLFKIADNYVGRKLSIISGIVFCVYPEFIYSANHLLSETLFILFFIIGTYFLVLGVKKGYWLHFCTSGVFFGLGSLTVSHMVGIACLMIIAILYIFRMKKKEAVVFILLFTSAVTLILLPWLTYIYFKYDRLVIISAKLGRILWGTHNPYGYSRYFAPFEREGEVWPEGLNEAELDWYLTKKALRYMRDEPSCIIKVGLRNLYLTVKVPTGDYNLPGYISHVFILLYSILYITILLFGLYGLALLVKRGDRTHIIYILYIIFTLVASFFLKGEIRYRTPVMPYLIILSLVVIDTKIRHSSDEKIVTK